MNRIFLAGLLGGIALFIWTHIAYTALPLGLTGLRKLPNETAVLDALQNNLAENSGIYLFPGLWLGPNPPDEKAEATNGFAEKVARYPSGILMYNAAGSRSVAMSRRLLVEFLTALAQAVLAVLLLSRTRHKRFGARATFALQVDASAPIAPSVSHSRVDVVTCG